VARAAYTEQDKARVYVVLTANEGNVKRTARETTYRSTPSVAGATSGKRTARPD
jgi:hypothetical protein